MTTINTSSLNSNPSPFTFVVKKPEADAVKASTTSATEAEKATDESTTVSTEVKTGAASGGGSVGGSSPSAFDETIEKIKQQIKDAQKQLAQLQAQLASAQSGKSTPEEKAQKAMAIQAQISATSANLQTLQGVLLQLQTEGGVKTTA
ncbi:hypothetical protein ACKUFS_14180 [Pseudomonas cannabina]|uniref:Uncharacterized protein n=3 Tax=Pseudomonas syringae group TaxID=136849 RepID=A0A3M3PSE6_PSECA|nr:MULTISPECIES: hypothetical protein [Pseudomonas syringae group]KPB77059.1 Uncharacterized protein AC507_0604 [Pseudomonas syringae pv. maculicola]KPW16958.1 Uncharacterized protein ALO83_00942 [Pseudomonas cannabina pv. alisalensis]MBM0141692.1 hypothetical protein [Pseudomonas cannabina pv. alisalensis]QHE96342.1 hypothetical protein PMA4326_006735 [Pseudomonas syringae pv. maculicola str. ES4326]QQN20600.1 hypothetical protein JGS08_18540 [Pseudomonas cannabina pv. alisalensis]